VTRWHGTAHLAAPMAEDGTQSCSRCGLTLHDNKTGAPAPWYPGQIVGVQQQGRVRVSLTSADEYSECGNDEVLVSRRQ
jgi:hypothetical protein